MKRSLICLLLITALLGLASRPETAGASPGPELSAPAGVPASEQAVVTLPAGASGDWWTAVQEEIARSEYEVTWQESTYLPDLPATYQAPNRAQGLRTYFAPDGPVVVPRVDAAAWRLDLRVAAEGAQPLLVTGNRVEYRYSDLVVEYANTEQGVDQTLSLPAPLGGAEGIALELALDTDMAARLSDDGMAVEFAGASGAAVLRYSLGAANDAQRQPLAARLELAGRSLRLVVAGRPAYPLAVTARLRSTVPRAAAVAAPEGLPPTAAWTAEGAQEGAAFGGSVGTAGDVNGDGYADVIVGARFYDSGETDEGRTFVYHGSASGLSLTPNWTAEGDQEGAYWGYSAGTAGDVNGDGYADVIVGAPWYTNDEAYEGRAFVYHGSASGLSASAAWTAEGDQEGAAFGGSVGTAGDVNGDGYADVIVGAPGYTDGEAYEGRAFVYHGSASGLSAAADWTAWSDKVGAYFGGSVGTAGDVNGDGYADVVVGARFYDNGQADEGRAYVYFGSASGLSPTANWTAESDQAGAWFGASVGTAGDVNGDGYADVVVGARFYDNGEAYEGRAYVYFGSASGLSPTANWTAEGRAYAQFGASVGTAGDVNGDGYADVIVGAESGTWGVGRALVYYGNASDGLEVIPQQRRAGDDAPVAPGGQSISPTEARLAALARTPFGRSQVRLEWEVKPKGTAFNGSGLGQSAWQDGGTAGYAFDELVSSLSFETRYHWRVRIVGRPANAATNSAVTYRSRWLRPAGSTFFTALSGQQSIGGAGLTNLQGQAAYVNVTTQGSLTGLTLRGYPQTAHEHENDNGNGALALDRYFTVTPNGGASGYDLTLCLNYDDAELDWLSETDLRLCRWAGTEYVCLPRSAASDTTLNLACADNVTTLSDWIIAGGNPTAVELAGFEVWPEGSTTHVQWETAQEIDNLGFNLYRADTLTGTQSRLNEALIPSQAPGSPVGAVYDWLDADGLEAGQTYYYWLEAVSVHGVTTRHGPVSATLSAGPYRYYLPLVGREF
jgi:hypothetical protein